MRPTGPAPHRWRSRTSRIPTTWAASSGTRGPSAPTRSSSRRAAPIPCTARRSARPWAPRSSPPSRTRPTGRARSPGCTRPATPSWRSPLTHPRSTSPRLGASPAFLAHRPSPRRRGPRPDAQRRGPPPTSRCRSPWRPAWTRSTSRRRPPSRSTVSGRPRPDSARQARAPATRADRSSYPLTCREPRRRRSSPERDPSAPACPPARRGRLDDRDDLLCVRDRVLREAGRSRPTGQRYPGARGATHSTALQDPKGVGSHRPSRCSREAGPGLDSWRPSPRRARAARGTPRAPRHRAGCATSLCGAHAVPQLEITSSGSVHRCFHSSNIRARLLEAISLCSRCCS